MFFDKLLLIVTVSTLVSGCASNPGGTTVSEVPKRYKAAIALCGGGLTSSVNLEIGAKLIENGGNLNASLTDELSGVLVSKANYSDEHAVNFLKEWHQCVMASLSDQDKAELKKK